MKSTILIFALLIFMFSLPSKACLNGETKELKNGAIIYTDLSEEFYPIPEGYYFKKENLNSLAQNLQNLYNKTKDLDYLSDKGYVLIIEKKYQEAIDLYLEIEKMKPNRYSTASNIGTAYELIGDNQNALKWIKKSIQINPNAHDGSEWIHAKILEAKIKGDAYVTSSFLLDTDFGTDDKPSTKLSEEALKKLEKELYYQLNERVSFIKDKDKIVALLLFELGNITYMHQKSNSLAVKLYEKAQEYGLSNPLLDKRLTFMHNEMHTEYLKKFPEKSIPPKDISTIEKKEPVKQDITKNKKLNYFYIYLSGVILIAGILFFLLRNKFKKKD